MVTGLFLNMPKYVLICPQYFFFRRVHVLTPQGLAALNIEPSHLSMTTLLMDYLLSPSHTLLNFTQKTGYGRT